MTTMTILKTTMKMRMTTMIIDNDRVHSSLLPQSSATTVTRVPEWTR